MHYSYNFIIEFLIIDHCDLALNISCKNITYNFSYLMSDTEKLNFTKYILISFLNLYFRNFEKNKKNNARLHRLRFSSELTK